MPAHLMGLLAIGTFYLITIVLGMCATRCLTDEEEGQEDDELKSQTDDGGGEDTLHLLRLLEQSLPTQVITFARLVEMSHCFCRLRSSLLAWCRIEIATPMAMSWHTHQAPLRSIY